MEQTKNKKHWKFGKRIRKQKNECKPAKLIIVKLYYGIIANTKIKQHAT